MPHPRRIGALAIVGCALLCLGQALTLVHLRPLSDYWYGIVWMGFILTADAFVAWRTGASLLLDRPRDAATMALVSASLWWVFEGVNVVLLDSWSYSPSDDVPRWVQRVRSTAFFATLLPATWEASLVALTLFPTRPREAKAARSVGLGGLVAGLLVGASIALLRPLALPLGLVALGLVTDAVNLLRGRPSLLAMLSSRAPHVPIAIGLGNVVAGFVGEGWNYPADPKWHYRVPYADVLRVFEMPLPGYLGYAALAFDLFALYQLVRPGGGSHSPLPPAHPLSLTGLGGPGSEGSPHS